MDFTAYVAPDNEVIGHYDDKDDGSSYIDTLFVKTEYRFRNGGTSHDPFPGRCMAAAG